MKRRLSAVLLAAGLVVSSFSMGVYADETEAEVIEQVTEAAEEILAEAETELEEAVEEAAEAAPEAEEVQAEAADMDSQMKAYMQQSLGALLGQLADMSEDQLNQIVEEGDASSARIAANWMTVRNDLGNLIEVAEPAVTTEGTLITAVTEAKYDGVNDATTVTITYAVDQAAQTFSIDWDIDYPMSTLMAQAGMNTLMGVGIVFLTLLFLSFLIGLFRFIPALLNKGKKNEPAPAVKPAAPVPAPVVEEEEYVDDLELVAVIAAAIAASENTSTDAFVVRSIKKSNKKNWQRA